MRTEILRRGWRVLAVGTMVLAVPALLQLGPLRGTIQHLASELRAAGAAGLVFYLLFYTLGCCVGAPLVLLSAVAGFAYGRWLGLPVAIVSLTFGTTVSYVLARRILRPSVTRWTASSERFARVQRMVEREGMRIVVLLRLTVVLPQGLLAHVLATTQLAPWRFALASFVGMLPATVVHVYLGSLAHDASAIGSGAARPPSWFTFAGIAVTLVTTGLLVRHARRELDAAMARSGDGPGTRDVRA